MAIRCDRAGAGRRAAWAPTALLAFPAGRLHGPGDKAIKPPAVRDGMAYDEGLAQRIEELIPRAEQKRMFGGLAFLERGNLVVGVLGDDLIARVGPSGTAKALEEPGVRPFDFTGKPMSGWVVVEQEAIAEDPDLARWVERCRRFTGSLPSK